MDESTITTPYVFSARTESGTVLIKIPETEWALPQNTDILGHKIAVGALREDFEAAIGMYGNLINIDRATPMDMNAALVDLAQKDKIISFSIIGYVPDESPAQVGDDGEEREIEWENED